MAEGIRGKNWIFGLGHAITEGDSEIFGSRLPTAGQVLRCFMFFNKKHASTGYVTKYDNAQLVLNKVVPFYQKANIPMIAKKKCWEKILALAEKNAKLREIPVARRNSVTTQKRLQDMEKELAQTMPLYPSNAEALIPSEEDKQFLLSMKTDRTASFGRTDQKLYEQEQRKKAGEEKAARQKAKAEEES